ncbi:hypothetical protein PRIPAC_96100 [Pristionchus pacificus]|uniref:G protein-coupled receptor n=1 Tax=Pristionchus pacificus TaxID=54126 RepID=A0A2A6D290_PRIPA|nr:hypothetical protein PRIPAC_96100 [Pristionchus pacificus]|eukprot:PDM84592.1 G protein-coupled receptor [Pristionchus pacificus]
MPQLIAQLRFNLLFESQDEYNCSASSVDWSTRGTERPAFGWLCILVSCMGIGPYLTCMPVLWRLSKNACYKMMFCLAILDLGVLIGNIFGGAVFIAGGMFCHAPNLFYALSFLAVGCFFSSCCACLMIAINRFVELFNIRLLLSMYQGNRPWLLMTIPVMYGTFAMLCTPFTQANSEAHLFLLDPMIHPAGKYEYTNYMLVANNFISPAFSSSLYLIMILKIVAKRGTMTSNDSVNRAAIMLSIQCGVIVIFHASTCLGYVGLQFYPSDFLCYAMQLSWIIMHGLPPYVYFAFNPSIRRGIIQDALPSQWMFVSNTGASSSIRHFHPSSIAHNSATTVV